MHHKWAQLPHAVRAFLTKAHTEMCEAIEDEMAAQGKPPIVLPAGHRFGDSDGAMRNTYRFAIAAPSGLAVGSTITCRLQSLLTPGVTTECTGTVAAASSRQLVITLRDDLGQLIAAGGLYVPRESVCLAEAQEQLRRVTMGLATFNAGVALQLLGAHEMVSLLPASAPLQPDLSCLTGSASALSFEQRQAVEDFLPRPFAAMWGPPGTGKTHVVAHGVAVRAEQFLASPSKGANGNLSKKPRILVVATSNLAVDEVMGRIATQLGDVVSVRAARVLRYGRQVTAAIVESHGEQIVYDKVVQRVRRERMRRAVDLAVRLESRLDELQEVEDFLHNVPVEFEEERSRLRRRHSRLAWYVCRFDAVVREHVHIFRDAFRDVRSLAREVLDSCQVLGTTVHQALMSRHLRNARWDCVVLEEGSQISAALGYALAIRARETAWLAGDFRQLEPVTEADTPLSARWLARDLFATSGSYSEDTGGTIDTQPFVSRLACQYRMHPDICAAVNAAYGGALRTDPATARARLDSDLVLPFPQHAGPAQRGIYLVDTTELRPHTRALPGGSRENSVHVAVVRAMLEVFEAKGLLPEIGTPPGRIAIISPFYSQARWISSIVEQRYPGRGIRSDTVHAYQGQGVDLLIVDLTEADGVTLSQWMHAREWSDSGCRLLTTALSRCKERCLVIADCGTLYGQLQSLVPRPQVYRLLRYLEQWGGSVDVQRDIITPAQALRQSRRLAEEGAMRRAGGQSS